MQTQTRSASWSRISALSPGLRPDVRIHRRHFRRHRSFVVQDPLSGHYFRLDPVSHHLVSLLDGKRTVEQAWQLTLDRFGHDAPNPDEVVSLLSQLYQANLLTLASDVDGDQLFARRRRRKRMAAHQQATSIMFVKFPLLEPSRLLDWLMPIVRPLFSRWTLLVWGLLVLAAVAQILAMFDVFVRDAARVFMPQNLAWLLLIFIVVKATHEFGHGLVCRFFGGPVHEMGVRLLVFMPVPYCDASSSWIFRTRHQRALVAAAGIIVETTFAAAAVLVWANTAADTLIHLLAYKTIFIAGIASVLFNANPLLRYDGYYVLQDLLDIPNLYQRANRQLLYMIQRFGFGMGHARQAGATFSEQFWLTAYAIASWTYRIFVFAAIIWFLSGALFGLGVVLAVVAGFTWLIQPLLKGGHWLMSSSALNRRRGRALAVTGLAVAAVVLLVGIIPVPRTVHADAVIEPVSRQDLVIQSGGFVQQVLVNDGDQVEQGQPLLRAANPSLEAELAELDAQLMELEVSLSQATADSAARASMLRTRIEAVTKRRRSVQQRLDELVVRSPLSGTLVAPELRQVQGRFLQRGLKLGQVQVHQQLRATAVLDQRESHWLDGASVRSVQLRPISDPSRLVPGTFDKALPAAETVLPHAALGDQGGGRVQTDRRDVSGRRSGALVFEAHVNLEPGIDLQPGQRARVRFAFEPQPLAWQWWRWLLQTVQPRYSVG